MTERVYLDYNATAPTPEPVREAVADALVLVGNPSSVHAEGRKARALVEAARESVAALVGAEARNVIFTSGGTEASMTALAPANVDREAPERVACFVSAIEHPSVLSGGRFAPDALRHIPVTGDGVVDLAAFERRIAEHAAETDGAPFMASIMRANNETGALQPVADAAEIVRAHDGILHCDLVQAAGKVPVDIGTLGAHMYSVSGHKIGAPKGIGALVLDPGFTALPAPLLTGGGQELRQRSGTENVPGIAGFGAAAALAAERLPQMAALSRMRGRMEEAVMQDAPETVVFSGPVERLPNTSTFAVPGMKAETLVIALDLGGVAVSAGASCSSGKVEPSHVLAAMGAPPELARGAIRVSPGWETTEADIDRFIAAWREVHGQIAGKRAAA